MARAPTHARVVEPAWQVARSADLAYPWAARDIDLRTRVAIRYLYRILAVCPGSEAASRALLDMNQLVSPPTAVFRPRGGGGPPRGAPPGAPGPPPGRGGGPPPGPAGPPLASGRAPVPVPVPATPSTTADR